MRLRRPEARPKAVRTVEELTAALWDALHPSWKDGEPWLVDSYIGCNRPWCVEEPIEVGIADFEEFCLK